MRQLRQPVRPYDADMLRARGGILLLKSCHSGLRIRPLPRLVTLLVWMHAYVRRVFHSFFHRLKSFTMSCQAG